MVVVGFTGPAAAASKPTPPPAVATANWVGNGTTWDGTTRALGTTNCDVDSTPYLYWVFSGSKATSASIALPDGTYNMGKPNIDKKGWSTFKYIWSPGSYITLGTLISGAPSVNDAAVSVTYNDAKNKGVVTISHGCQGPAPKNPCATDPLVGITPLNNAISEDLTWNGFNSAAQLNDGTSSMSLSAYLDGFGGVEGVAYGAYLGCLSLTASEGAYVSDTASNVIYSFNQNTVLSTVIFPSGDPYTSGNGCSITAISEPFPDLTSYGGECDLTDAQNIVYTLHWYTAGDYGTGTYNTYSFVYTPSA